MDMAGAIGMAWLPWQPVNSIEKRKLFRRERRNSRDRENDWGKKVIFKGMLKKASGRALFKSLHMAGVIGLAQQTPAVVAEHIKQKKKRGGVGAWEIKRRRRKGGGEGAAST